MTTTQQLARSIPTTARALLGADLPELVARLRDARLLQETEHALGRSAGSVAEGAYGELAGVVDGFLQLDLGTVLVTGWRRHRELHDAAVRTRESGGSAVVSLAGRDLSLTQSHEVDVLIGNVRVTVVTFELDVEVTGIGVSGVVRGGSLVSLTSGGCEVEVSLQASGALLARRRRSIEPRLVVDLRGGVLLVPREQARHRPDGEDHAGPE